MNTGIATIPVFDFKTLVDLTGQPKIVLTNASTGTQVDSKIAFKLLSPLGLPIHSGDITTPDVTGKWTSFEITDLPAYNSQLEWGTYTIVANLRVGATDLFLSYPVVIARPAGNKMGNNYGLAELVYEVRCNTGKIYIEDNTAHVYLGAVGHLVSRGVTMIYPPDSTGVPPETKTSSVQNSTFDIYFNGEGYTVLVETVYDYLLDNNVVVRIKYKASECLEVACNIDLCKVLYEVEQFREKVMCHPNQTQNILKLVNVSTLLTQVLIAKMQPGCGISIHKQLKKVSDILGVDCYCSTGTGIGNDRDSVKSIALQVFNLAKADSEVKGAFCTIDCGCPQWDDVAADVVIPPTTVPPATVPPTTVPATVPPTTVPPTTAAPTTVPPTTAAPTTVPPTTAAPTTVPPTTAAPTTVPATTTAAPTTVPATTTAAGKSVVLINRTADTLTVNGTTIGTNATGVVNLTRGFTLEETTDHFANYYVEIRNSMGTDPSYINETDYIWYQGTVNPADLTKTNYIVFTKP